MKKVLIINDTSSECHHGCDLVTKNIKKYYLNIISIKYLQFFENLIEIKYT